MQTQILPQASRPKNRPEAMLPLPWCIFFSGWIQCNALWRISNSSSKKNYAHIKSLIGPFSLDFDCFFTLLRRILGLKIGTAISVYWLATFVLGFFVIHTLVGLGWDQYYYVNRTANTSSMEPGTAPAMHCHTRKKKRWKEGWCSLSFASVRAGTKTRWAPAQLPLWKSLSAFPDY